jgi:hypothetical protein
MASRRWSTAPSRAAVLALVIALLGILVAACGGSQPPAETDPYAIVTKSADAPYDKLKVQVGLETKGNPEGDIKIDPSAIEVVVDSKAGTGSFRLSLPASALGEGASGLAQLGITGDTLDIEVLFDGDALYAKSPLFATILPMLMAQTGQTVSGDLTGWLKLGTASEFEGLVGALGGVAQPSAAPSFAIGDLEPADLKKQLEEAGVALAYVGTEQRNGADAEHLTMTMDFEKLAASPMADQLPADQLSQLKELAGTEPVTMDLWFDKASGRLSELSGTVKADGQEAAIKVLVSDPGAVTIAAPADAVEVPIAPLLLSLLQMFGGSLGA